jgi:hypothetical protein
VEFERGSCTISRQSDEVSSLATLADRSWPPVAWARESWRLGHWLLEVVSESLSESSSHRLGYFSFADRVSFPSEMGLSSMSLVSVLAVPLASMVRTTDVRGRGVSAIEDSEPRAVRFKGEERREMLQAELLRASGADGSWLCETIFGLDFEKLAAMSIRSGALALTGEPVPAVWGTTGPEVE